MERFATYAGLALALVGIGLPMIGIGGPVLGSAFVLVGFVLFVGPGVHAAWKIASWALFGVASASLIKRRASRHLDTRARDAIASFAGMTERQVRETALAE